MRMVVAVVVVGLIVLGCWSVPPVDLAAGSGCSDVLVDVAQRGGTSVAAASAGTCRDGAGAILPDIEAVDRLAFVVWNAELPRFDRVDAVVYASAETWPRARATIRSYTRHEMETRWGARPVSVDLAAERSRPTGPWVALPVAFLLVLGAACRGVRSGALVVWVRVR